MALVDLEATVSSIDNSRLMVAPKTADINTELLRDLLRSQELQQQSVSLKQRLDEDRISRTSSQESLEKIRSLPMTMAAATSSAAAAVAAGPDFIQVSEE